MLCGQLSKADVQGIVGITAVISCVVLNRRSLWGYKGDEQVPFIKITCTDQKAIPKVRDKSSLFGGMIMYLR
jgi:hypothetical protein